MKKSILLVMALVSIFSLQAQDAAVIKSAEEIVWFGIDFTKATFVGQFDQGMGMAPATGLDIKNKWIPQWNSLIVNEPQNFDFKKSLKKKSVYNDITTMNELNRNINTEKCMDYNPGKIERTAIDEMVKKYTSATKKEGVGLAFIVENFDKGAQTAGVYVTYFDIKTKKVIKCDKYEGKAVGIGMRNYWAGSIKSIIKQLANS